MHVIDHTAYATYVCQKTRQENHTAKVVDITPIQVERSNLLTDRELEILDLVVQEYSSKQIASGAAHQQSYCHLTPQEYDGEAGGKECGWAGEVVVRDRTKNKN